MARKPSWRSYEPMGGSSRRYRHKRTGETISRRQWEQLRLNEGRPKGGPRMTLEKAVTERTFGARPHKPGYAGIAAKGKRTRQEQAKDTVRRFMDRLRGGADVETARREAGLSRTAFEEWRRQEHQGGSPFYKEKGRWKAREFRSYTHTFINADGHMQEADFMPPDIGVMQSYRSDVDKAKQTGDATVLKKYEGLVIRDAHGNRVYPSTDLAQIEHAEGRMTPRKRREFERKRYYSEPGDVAQLAA